MKRIIFYKILLSMYIKIIKVPDIIHALADNSGKRVCFFVVFFVVFFFRLIMKYHKYWAKVLQISWDRIMFFF